MGQAPSELSQFSKDWKSRIPLIVAIIMSAGLALGSMRYLIGVGPFPPKIVANALAVPWLTVHVAASAVALFVGGFQFVGRIRRGNPSVHRWLGRVYVVCCLTGGAIGLALAFGTTMGPVTTGGFGVLAIIWMLVTLNGWQLARKRRFIEHRRWMIRSWALTFAAVNLRIYLGLAFALGMPFETSYPAISILCWVPNLLIAEFYIRFVDRYGRIRPAAT